MASLSHSGQSHLEHSLNQRRDRTEAQWAAFVHSDPAPDTTPTTESSGLPHQTILESWQRSADCLPELKQAAPADMCINEPEHDWKGSQLYMAALREQSQLMQLAREGELVAAIADPTGRLLWTHASTHMRSRAESVNFRAGGHWDEESVGTNAVGLSLRLRESVTVFSSEHYQPFVHDWVCYAAPIVHPKSGELVGLLDMSTTWNRHTPLGQAAVTQLARSIAQNLPDTAPRAELEIRALGQPRVVFRGKALNLPQRQLEILCLLALNPQGLNLASFHAALYGDDPVSTATLKSELSHLRRVLDGRIGSRPYRLLVPLWADFIDIWQALRENKRASAMSLYRGVLLPTSLSPELEEWRHCIDAAMTRCLANCNDARVLMRKLGEGRSGNELVRDRLALLANR